jgi:hypothetical protein
MNKSLIPIIAKNRKTPLDTERWPSSIIGQSKSGCRDEAALSGRSSQPPSNPAAGDFYWYSFDRQRNQGSRLSYGTDQFESF